MVDTLAVPFFVAAGLLVASGLVKLHDPTPLRRATRELGFPLGGFGVRAFGCAEVVVGSTALFLPSGGAVALACMYGLFAGVLVKAMRSAVPLTSCGCIGKHDAPPSITHVFLNVTAMCLGGLLAVLPGVSGLITFTSDLGDLAAPVSVGSITIAYLLYAVVAYLPSAWTSYQDPRTAPPEGRTHAA